MAAQLIVSLSGLTDDSAVGRERAARFTAELHARAVPVAHLYQPGRPRPGSPLAEWMHERVAAGDEIVLHGYDHSTAPSGALTWAHRPARRAEFATLPRHEAGLRLTAARRALTVAGLRTEVFAPPRWVASEGTVAALREQGFAVLADDVGVHMIRSGEVLRSRALGFRVSGLADDGRTAESWRARLLLAEVGRIARRGGLVRVNVRAKDLKRSVRRDAALAAVDLALELGAAPRTHVGVAAGTAWAA